MFIVITSYDIGAFFNFLWCIAHSHADPTRANIGISLKLSPIAIVLVKEIP